MERLSWIGFLAFFLVALAVGVRLVRLGLRTRRLPELLIGIGVLGIGPVGFGLLTVAVAVLTEAPGLSQVTFCLALLALCCGIFAKFVFNWRVYHPTRRGVAAGVALAGVALLACLAAEWLGEGFREPDRLDAVYVTRALLQIGCLLWGAVEALVYWRKLVRRARIGLADPVVANRFLLWGVGAGAAGLGTAVGVTAQFVTGVPMLEISWLRLSSSMHGLVAAIAMWLAFLPPASYLRYIASQQVDASSD